MKKEILDRIVTTLNNLRDELTAEVEEDKNEKKEVLRMFARFSLITGRD